MDDTSSEQHRHETEARTVMRWPKAQREAFYKEVAAKRGEKAAQALIAEVNRQWHLDMMGQP